MNGYPGLNCYLPFKFKVLIAGSRRLDLHMATEK